MSSYFAGRKALITGGSSGIGRSAAMQIAAAGGSVVIAARGQESLDKAVADIRAVAAQGAVVDAVSVDVTDRPGVQAACDQAIELMGGVDLLINNSGYAWPKPVDELSDDDFDRMMNVNYMGHVNVTRALLPHFKQRKSGDIALVTSMLGFMSFYGYSAYAASKFAIVGFGESLRQELIEHNVNVTLFYPPTTDTPGLETENTVKPAATWAIEGKSKAFAADDVARSLLKGIRKRRFTNMIGASNWAIYYLNRWFPGLVRWVIDGDLKKHLKKEGRS